MAKAQVQIRRPRYTNHPDTELFLKPPGKSGKEIRIAPSAQIHAALGSDDRAMFHAEKVNGSWVIGERVAV